MKTTKKWFGVVAITTLLSCQYSPATASSVGAVPIPTPSYNNVGLQLSYCESLADFSATAMDARQVGVSFSDAIKSAPKADNQTSKRQIEYLKGVVKDVYTYPILDTQEEKLWISEQYSKLTYMECIYK